MTALAIEAAASCAAVAIAAYLIAGAVASAVIHRTIGARP